jgi:type II secretory pathway pseudopilin PulG
MLIVILLIGILAVALIPKLLSLQERARDTRRTADVHVIGQALQLHKTDTTKYPEPYLVSTCAGSAYSDFSTSQLATPLKNYLTSLPSDPTLRGISGIYRDVNPSSTCTAQNDSSYLYTTLEKNGDLSGGILVLA